MDLSQYLPLFISESREYLKAMAEHCVLLEESPCDRARIDALFRAAHSLKGMAASMELTDMVTLAHAMEELMMRVRDGGLGFDQGIADLLLEGADLLESMLGELEGEGATRHTPGDLPGRLAGYQPQPKEAPPPSPAAAEPLPAAAEPLAAGAEPLAAGGGGTVRVRTELLDHLVNLTGELIGNKHRLLSLGRELRSPALDEALAESSKLLHALQDEVMKVRLMPFDAICDRLRRSMRDLAKRSGKAFLFEIEGREIGLDRGVLEQLADPLTHILRNAVDHGLEPGEKRKAAGKPEKGSVRLAVSRDRDQVLVTVTDDGRGMEPEKLVAAAVRKGLIGADEGETLSPRQALMLVCIPGFTTAPEVTEISGRGVGMDAVSASIQKLGGSVSIESEPGAGSRFTLRLPMSIATVHALVVQCGALKGAVPVSAVLRSVELRREQIESRASRKVFLLEGEEVPLLSLNRILGVPMGRFADGILPLFVTEAKGRRVGLVVDRLLGQHELFVKPLGRPLSRLKGVAGGATLGDGEVVSLLDLAELL